MEKFTNKLIEEKSPYLLQHAHNPVDWFPWSKEAFEKAKNEDKPVFLSIGYSTCHWCHVMERESFEDEEVAKELNDAFVCIKVDREERPDLDSTYMIVSQMMTGTGGWPLNIIMTPEKKPIFALTYIPRESRRGMMGIIELTRGVKELWKDNRDELERKSDEIISNMKMVIRKQKGDLINEETLQAVYNSLKRNYDTEFGGFGGAPKFPSPHNLIYLMRYFRRYGDQESLEMVEKTLLRMRLGGVYDQVGFGFHRYSTDAGWFLPHFEKMIYDQALLMMAYTDAFVLTGNDVYKHIVDEIAEFLKRDMVSPEGGFYTAIDADSENEEGKYYTWKYSELISVLGKDDGDFIADLYQSDTSGNYVEESTGRSTGKNILHLDEPLMHLAKKRGVNEEELFSKVNRLRGKLLTHRAKRIPPSKDDKMLTDMNGLVIAALSRAYQKLSDDSYLDMATAAADFVLKRMYSNGKLLHRYREDNAFVDGFIDDYSFLIWGLIELYEATFDPKYLENALDLCKYTLEHFWDSENGGFFYTSDESDYELLRTKEGHDGAVPSGNSVMMLNLLRISMMTGNQDIWDKAIHVASSVSEDMKKGPMFHTFLATAIDFAVGPSFEVTVVGKKDAPQTVDLIDEIRQRYLPNKVTLLYDGQDDKIKSLSEVVSRVKADPEGTVAYVCRGDTCFPPVKKASELIELLNGKGP